VPYVQSVNVGIAREIRAKSGTSGIDKRPTTQSVAVSAPGPKGQGGSGLAGDVIVDLRHHGGDEQAVYAFAREDLDEWQTDLGELRSGVFGENITTSGIDVTDALIGEQWRLGEDLILQVTSPRVPCATFAVWMERKGWLKSFTLRARPGAYLRVLAPGDVRAGDPISVVARPDHPVTIGLMFRALTLEHHLLPTLLAASEFLTDEMVEWIEERADRRG
jgi:MOSC domain-containing protein YiiM